MKKDPYDPSTNVEDQRGSFLSNLSDYLLKSARGTAEMDNNMPNIWGTYPDSHTMTYPEDTFPAHLNNILMNASTFFKGMGATHRKDLQDFHGNVFKNMDDYLLNHRQYQRIDISNSPRGTSK